MKETDENSTIFDRNADDDIEATDDEMKGVAYFGLFLFAGLVAVAGMVGCIVIYW